MLLIVIMNEYKAMPSQALKTHLLIRTYIRRPYSNRPALKITAKQSTKLDPQKKNGLN